MSSAEQIQVNARLPPDLIEQVDAFAEKSSTESSRMSRNGAFIALLRKGLTDATRPRKASR